MAIHLISYSRIYKPQTWKDRMTSNVGLSIFKAVLRRGGEEEEDFL